MSTMSTISIQTTDVVKEYPSITIAIPHINVTSRITLIKGKNGSGKSTLLKALMGWIHYNGTIQTTHTFSYMPEHPSFPKDVSVMTFLRTLHPKSTDIQMLLQRFRIDHKSEEDIDALSKGMKSKLNIIQCLLKKADIYLLDEPFSGLDVDSVYILVDYIKQSKKAFIITTHIEGVQLEGDVISFD